MFKRSFHILFALVLLMNLLSCQHLQGLMVPKEKPTLTYKTVRIRDLSFQSVTLDFDFELKNPYDVGMTLANLDYKLDVDGRPLLQGKTNKEIVVKAKDSSIVTLPYTIEFIKVAQALASLFSSRNELPYMLQLGFGVKTPIGVIQLPIKVDGKVPLPKLPDVSVAGVKLDSMGFTGAQISFNLKVKNNSSFPLRLKGTNYDMKIAGVNVSNGQVAVPEVSANQAATVKIPLKLNFLKLGLGVVKVVKSKKVDYDLGGALDLGVLKKAFNLKGTANL